MPLVFTRSIRFNLLVILFRLPFDSVVLFESYYFVDVYDFFVLKLNRVRINRALGYLRYKYLVILHTLPFCFFFKYRTFISNIYIYLYTLYGNYRCFFRTLIFRSGLCTTYYIFITRTESVTTTPWNTLSFSHLDRVYANVRTRCTEMINVII